MKLGLRIFLFLICVFYFCLFIFNFSFAQPKEYDGIWFMGLNQKKKVLQKYDVRKAINYAIDKKHITTKIMSEEIIPISIIPPGLLGFDENLLTKGEDLKYARFLMRNAGYPIKDRRLKKMSLLHTDGVKTIEIAEKLKDDLAQIGMKIKLVEVSYRDEKKWSKELASGKYDFFLMGYKANINQFFTVTEEATAQEVNTYNLLEPLFHSQGEANFTFYHNPEVDEHLEKISNLDISLKNLQEKLLKEINNILYHDLPVVVLFYIEKL